jgi:hypothetical protein
VTASKKKITALAILQRDDIDPEVRREFKVP